MAEQTLTLNMTQAAYITSYAPDTTGPKSAGDEFEISKYGALCMRFAAIPSSLKYKRLLEFRYIGVSDADGIVYVDALSGIFEKASLTWNNMPSRMYRTCTFKGSTYLNLAPYILPGDSAKKRQQLAKAFLQYSCLYLQPTRAENMPVRLSYCEWVSGSGYHYYNPPKVEIQYDDGADVTSQVKLTGSYSGYVDRTKEKTFTWSMEQAGTDVFCAANFYVETAKLYWKSSGESSYHEVTGSRYSATIPANTFPANSTITGYVEVTDDVGTTSTATFAINTIDTTAVATAISPMNTVEDGGAEINFRWELSNAYGNDPSLVNLWWKLPSEDNQSWHVLISSTDPITEYTVPANTFPAGEIQWLVHAYNQDDVRGPDSQGSFICVAAPTAPNGISADGAPYTTIQWQCEGQQAYRIEIDGKDYGTKFGTTKSITLDEPLADGEHTVSITAQGVYGLWSQPGTTTFTVTNTPGDSVTLSGTEGADAVLTWETASATNDFYVYRDGIRIGHTSGKSFADRLAVGTHSYYVLNKLSDGNYTRSNTVTLTLSTDDTLIAEFPPIEWLSIRLTENSEPQHQYSYQKTQTTRHFYGAEYPVLEDSSFADMSGSFDTAFIDAGQAERFEQLKGKAVVMKSKNGVFVGAMSTMQKTVRQFFTAYTFDMTRIHWEDYIDETNA